ncbi:MAG: replication initiator protein [Microvirus sp.]|nr:MAG: replication initiator protein [Microvirus sp.]
MTCYHPIPAYQDKAGDELRLWPPVGTANLNIPCGGCLGCKTTHATDWARRAEHEASQWEHNSFVTLTYDDEHLPKEGNLDRQALAKFLKRLRRLRDRNPHLLRFNPRRGLRYLACGEYGERNGRPHYHLLIFNCGFADLKMKTPDLGESPTLAKLWDLGTHTIGAVTGASANYVAQYTLKKQGSTYADPDGVVKTAPFLRMSLKPAIGTDWIASYKKDLTHGYLVTNGTKGRVPRAYRQQLQKTDPQLAEQIAYASEKNRPRRMDNLRASEIIHTRRLELARMAKRGNPL